VPWPVACGGNGTFCYRAARRVADEPRLAVSAAFRQKNGLDALADQDSVRGVPRRINGGFNGLDDQVSFLVRSKGLLVDRA